MMNYYKNTMKFGKKSAITSKRHVDNEKHPKTKIKSYKGKINTHFHNKKTPK